jgi:hypothetical protein
MSHRQIIYMSRDGVRTFGRRLSRCGNCKFVADVQGVQLPTFKVFNLHRARIYLSVHAVHWDGFDPLSSVLAPGFVFVCRVPSRIVTTHCQAAFIVLSAARARFGWVRPPSGNMPRISRCDEPVQILSLFASVERNSGRVCSL